MANVEISDTFVIFIIFGKILINIHTASNFQFSWAEFLTIFFKWFPVALHLNMDIARLQKVPKIWIFPLHNLKENIDYIFNDSTIRCRKLSFHFFFHMLEWLFSYLLLHMNVKKN